VTEDIEERVARLEERIELMAEQLERLVDAVDGLNKSQMSHLYRHLVAEGDLEDMREKYPDMVNDLEQTAQEHMAPIIEEINAEGESR